MKPASTAESGSATLGRKIAAPHRLDLFLASMLPLIASTWRSVAPVQRLPAFAGRAWKHVPICLRPRGRQTRLIPGAGTPKRFLTIPHVVIY